MDDNELQIPSDIICSMHGLPLSGHDCLYCCLCFRDLTLDECNLTDDGRREDVCLECALNEGVA